MDSIKAFVKYLTLLLSTARVICCCQLHVSFAAVNCCLARVFAWIKRRMFRRFFRFIATTAKKCRIWGRELRVSICASSFFSIPRNWLPARNKYHVIRYELLYLHFTCEKYIAKRNKRFWLDKYRWKGIKEGFNFFKLGTKLISLKSWRTL